VTERQPYEVRIAAPAFHDIGDIWTWTVERFGHAAALRYEMPIDQAIADLADDPARPTAKERPDLMPGLWLYHLAFSRAHVPEDQVVKSPRHFVDVQAFAAGRHRDSSHPARQPRSCQTSASRIDYVIEQYQVQRYKRPGLDEFACNKYHRFMRFGASPKVSSAHRPSWARSFVLLALFSSATAKEKHHPPLEQTEFSAEEDGVHKPVAVPPDVMAILKTDEWVHDTLESEGIPADKLPASWFSASEIHLSTASRSDLVVVGEPPLTGANVALFWVFISTSHGYKLGLRQSAHDLTIKSARRNGYREIEASAESSITFYSALFYFDGDQYVKRSGKTLPLD
jgi:plasmid stabilization system protein ParE